MPYNEMQAALALAEFQRQNRELREQLRQALERGDQLADENRQLKERLEELEREAARQAAPFRRRPRKKVDPAKKNRPGQKRGMPVRTVRFPIMWMKGSMFPWIVVPTVLVRFGTWPR